MNRKEEGERMTAAEMNARWRAGKTAIDELPPVAHPRCKARAKTDVEYFLRHYFPGTYDRPFSDAHKRYIADLVDIAHHGGRKVIVLPRGCGKTSVALGVVAWLLLHGVRKYVIMLASTEGAAKRLCSDLAHMLMDPAILNDWPECLCFSFLGGRPQRAASQTLNGKPTNVQLSSTMIVFPTTGNASDGATVEIMALTGNIRGRHRLADGKMMRPDFVVIDDPSTAESAKSDQQNLDRLRIIESDVLGLAGHNRSVATVCTATIICDGDLAEMLLAKKDWRGQRVPIIDGWGGKSLEKSWKAYDDARLRVLEGSAKPGSENTIYRKMQKKVAAKVTPMDPSLVSKGEVDAIQHARNKLIELGEFAFASEMLNKPKSDRPTAPYRFAYGDVLARLNHRKRGELPEDTVDVVAAVDINQYALAWSVVALTSTEEYAVIDYGWAVPKGKSQVWTSGENRDVEIGSAVRELVLQLMTRSEYASDITKLTVDAGFAAEVVYGVAGALARDLKPRRVVASRGLPADKYFPPRTRRGVFGRGDGCDIRRTQTSGGLVLYWDSHKIHMDEQQAWLLPPGVAGSCTVFGDDIEEHREFAMQVAADRLVRTAPTGDGRTIATWSVDRHNEMSDTVAMCFALLGLGRTVAMFVKERAEKSEERPVEASAKETGGSVADKASKPAVAPPAAPRRASPPRRPTPRRGNWLTSF